MRITGGTLRSRKLRSIESTKLRPATDRLRETMFNILANILDLKGAAALDLYAGTGSVGFETISRGAEKVVFVEADKKIADILKENSRALGVEEKCEIRVMKVEKFLKLCDEKFNIAYIDPPYAVNRTTDKIVDEILSRKIVNESGIICVEHSKDYSPPQSLLLRQKVFGSTFLSFIKPEEK